MTDGQGAAQEAHDIADVEPGTAPRRPVGRLVGLVVAATLAVVGVGAAVVALTGNWPGGRPVDVAWQGSGLPESPFEATVVATESRFDYMARVASYDDLLKVDRLVEDRRTVEAALIHLENDCLAPLGVTIEADLDGDFFGGAEPELPPQVSEEEFAEAMYGPVDGEQVTIERGALGGFFEMPSAGCFHEARVALFGAEHYEQWLRSDETVLQAIRSPGNLRMISPAFVDSLKAAEEEWRECMVDAGYEDVRTPFSSPEDDAEEQVHRACRDQVDWSDKLAAEEDMVLTWLRENPEVVSYQGLMQIGTPRAEEILSQR